MSIQTTDPITAEAIETAPEGLTVNLRGRRITIPWESCSQSLARASLEERLRAELSPGGYGIHWPLIDEDLTIGGLVKRSERPRVS